MHVRQIRVFDEVVISDAGESLLKADDRVIVNSSVIEALLVLTRPKSQQLLFAPKQGLFAAVFLV